MNLRVILLSLLVMFSSPLLAKTQSSKQNSKGSVYCCNASNGQEVCADRVMQQCLGKDYKEITATGMTTLHRVATKDPAQSKAEQEQKRKDSALMSTYASLDDLNNNEKKEVDPIVAEIIDEQKSANTIRQRLIALKKDDLATPAQELQMRQAEMALQSHQQLILLKQKTVESTRQRYKADRDRYQQLIASGMVKR